MDDSASDSDSGGRVDATRALKPREKDGGRMENSWVWKLRMYAEEMVVPSLRMFKLVGR